MSKYDEVITITTPNGNITASKYLLNSISIAFSKCSEKFKEDGAPALACDAENIADAIYDELKKTNFYED